mmetsp:Transcript_14213/g.26817  ORF Transcript_14213/g.26817 Transcript_14213/m.26817 type:complete len:425 (+) Transcript_14213:2492-3766(+)
MSHTISIARVIMEDPRSGWNIKASNSAMQTRNPVREIAARIVVPAGHPKKPLDLTFGDPSAYGDFPAAPEAVQILKEAIEDGKGNGYMPSLGTGEVRQAIADYYSNEQYQLTIDDVSIDFGGSGAVYHAIRTLCNPGDNYLIPSPGFPLYASLANCEFDARTYRLKPDTNWEADLEDLESKIDKRTKVIVVINPSNPCGSVYSREHLNEIVQLARRHHLPILADEVYEGISFTKPFISLSQFCHEVPIIVIGCLSKRWLTPGWRIGWILIYDKLGAMAEFKLGLARLKNALIHPTTFIVKALPRIFKEVPDSFFTETTEKLKLKAFHFYERVRPIPGLKALMPEGSIYCVVLIDFEALIDVTTSLQFCELMSKEQGVALLPLEAFFSSGGFRVVICTSTAVIDELADRLLEFMQAHMAVQSNLD